MGGKVKFLEDACGCKTGDVLTLVQDQDPAGNMLVLEHEQGWMTMVPRDQEGKQWDFEGESGLGDATSGGKGKGRKGSYTNPRWNEDDRLLPKGMSHDGVGSLIRILDDKYPRSRVGMCVKITAESRKGDWWICQDGSKQLYMVPKNEQGMGWDYDHGQFGLKLEVSKDNEGDPGDDVVVPGGRVRILAGPKQGMIMIVKGENTTGDGICLQSEDGSGGWEVVMKNQVGIGWCFEQSEDWGYDPSYDMGMMGMGMDGMGMGMGMMPPGMGMGMGMGMPGMGMMPPGPMAPAGPFVPMGLQPPMPGAGARPPSTQPSPYGGVAPRPGMATPGQAQTQRPPGPSNAPIGMRPGAMVNGPGQQPPPQQPGPRPTGPLPGQIMPGKQPSGQNNPVGTVQRGPGGVQVITLNAGWVKIVQPDNKPPYYHNPKTNVTQWTPPPGQPVAAQPDPRGVPVLPPTNGNSRMNDTLAQVARAGRAVVDSQPQGGGMSLEAHQRAPAPQRQAAPTKPVPEGPKGKELQDQLNAISKQADDRRTAADKMKEDDENKRRQQDLRDQQMEQQKRQQGLVQADPGAAAPARAAPAGATGVVGTTVTFLKLTNAPADGYLTADAGEKVEILHQEGDWYYGKTPNGAAGWFPVAHVG